MTSTTTLTLTFFRGKKGDVVSRLPNGKLALVNRKSNKKPKDGEKWLCQLDFEKPNFAVVTPIARVVKKKRPVLQRYNCGHPFIAWYEDVEVPENVDPEPRDSGLVEPRFCDECRKKCKHEDIEFCKSSFWVAIGCKTCGATLWDMDISELEDADRALAEIEKRFPQVADEAREFLNEWKQWCTEYVEKSKNYNKLTKKIRELKNKIIAMVGRELDDFYIDTERQQVVWCEYHQFAPEEPYDAVEMRAPLPEEHRDEILKIWSEVVELKKRANELHWWLTENRPIE